MKKTSIIKFGTIAILVSITAAGCNQPPKEKVTEKVVEIIEVESEIPEYFLLRPAIEKAYGYSHAVRIGNDIKISGAVSMDDEGNVTAVGNFQQQMINCYADLDKILKHFGCTFNDVIVENVFTTNMPKFLDAAVYRNEIYTKQFPTGSWLGVKELALPELMIEIELEVYKAD
ncbi:MAG: RidA family protein [Maribacter arcticus]|uniref:RidA family protein n=1 Tax=Maribacter arcticus TaxID=561365 RepID=UPI003001F507